MRAIPRRSLLGAASVLVAACGPGQAPRPETAPDVTSEDLRNPNESVITALQRKVPGLIVTRAADGGIALRLRGGDAGLLPGRSAEPLYILNGSPFTPGAGGALTGIDPNEIDTIRVLKGADAAIYGSDAVHGAIVVTTKRGPRLRP